MSTPKSHGKVMSILREHKEKIEGSPLGQGGEKTSWAHPERNVLFKYSTILDWHPSLSQWSKVSIKGLYILKAPWFLSKEQSAECWAGWTLPMAKLMKQVNRVPGNCNDVRNPRHSSRGNIQSVQKAVKAACTFLKCPWYTNWTVCQCFWSELTFLSCQSSIILYVVWLKEKKTG